MKRISDISARLKNLLSRLRALPPGERLGEIQRVIRQRTPGAGSRPSEESMVEQRDERSNEERKRLHEKRKLEQRKRHFQQRKQNFERRKKRNERMKMKNVRSRLYDLGFTERALEELEGMLEDGSSPFLKTNAAWELSVWHASRRDEEGARHCLEYLSLAEPEKGGPERSRRAAVIEAEARKTLGDADGAERALSRALASKPRADLLLARANLAAPGAERIEWINEALELHGIPRVSLDASTGRAPLDSLSCEGAGPRRAEDTGDPKVSVIMPARDAEDMVGTALDSILAQTWTNLEVLVVDDHSADGTARIAEEYASRDARVRLIRAEEEGGEYVARNLGLRGAAGEFATTHGADEWSHPEKIERQISHLLDNPSVVGNTSQRLPATPELEAVSQTASSDSSLMFRRGPVMESVGYWDRVRFGADEEFKKRVERVFGDGSVADVATGPLAFARTTAASPATEEVPVHDAPLGAAKEYRASFERFHETAGELRYEFLPDGRPFAAPEPMWAEREVEDGGRRRFDVILASDFRLPGGTTSSNVEEIKAQKRMGLRTGLMLMPVYTNPATEANSKIRELVDGNLVQMLVYGEKVSCDALILRYPPSIRQLWKFVPDVEAKDVHIVVNQTPMRDYGEAGVVAYDIAECDGNVRRRFKKSGTWHPIGPLVRRALHRSHAEELAGISLAGEDWTNIIDVDEWRRESRPPREPGARIGRHSRDATTKWPESRDELLAAYPDSDGYEVHILGGAKTPTKKLGGELPENWRVLEFGEARPKEFLSKLDVFVYYTHPDLMEAFGRAIVEAMAVGVPAILPHIHRELFGEAAIYAEPSEVKEDIDRLMDDDEYYESRVRVARDYVERNFGYTKHAERLGRAGK